MRVLFVMQSPEYLRFYESTIRLLAARGHTVLLAVNKQNEAKPVRLDDVGGPPPGEAPAGRAGSVISLGIVPRRDDVWRHVGRRLRGLMDFARYLDPRLARAKALRARMKHKVLPRGFRWLDRVPSLPGPLTRALLGGLAALERTIPLSPAIQRFITDAAPEVVLVSPLVDAASDQVDIVKGARALGIPVAACIASWDNLTNKGMLRVQPDAVIVWNEAQKAEAVAFHGVPADRVRTTGAQLFDRWFAERPSTTRERFCARLGLPASQPFVLFTCSSSFIALSQAEVVFVARWLQRLRQHPVLRGVAVLVRPHPYNCAAWETADLARPGEVAIWPRRAYNPIDEEHRRGFFDSLYHSAAVVGVNTSAMIEAAIVGRPVLSMLSSEFSGTQEGTLHFHHLLPENGGFLRMAASLDEHVAQLAEVMRNPEAVRAETERFVRSFIRPHGIERDATPLVADAVEQVASQPAGVPAGSPVWAPVGRAVMLGAGAYVWCCNLARDAEHRRKTRKRLMGNLRHRRKAMRKDLQARGL
ncbi:MAG: hypothetical protein HY824_10140 [Acidobacteria bacterium]|nr:hypothetical protein [Acidobacteriota bacterium]